jgi:uncharacterized YigZ family protein
LQTVDREFTFTLEEKRSKFITYLFPYKDYKNILERLKNENPKGRHFVSAFRYLNEFEQIVEGSSDDGEPKGTSGKPSLSVLQGSDLIDIGVIIVRYFGGIKLGTGGLVRAYSSAVNSVVSVSQLVERKKLEKQNFSILYPEISRFKYQIEQLNLEIIDEVFEIEGGKFTVLGEKEKISELSKLF